MTKRLARVSRFFILLSSLFILILLSSLFTPVSAQVRIKPGTASGSGEGFNLSSSQRTSAGNRPQGNGLPGNDSIAYSDTSATKGLVFHEEIPDSVLRNKVFFFLYAPRGA